jgi:HupE / UreJ protein
MIGVNYAKGKTTSFQSTLIQSNVRQSKLIHSKLIQQTLFLLLYALVMNANADPQSKSFSLWLIDNNTITATFTIASREVTRLRSYSNNANTLHIFSKHLLNTVSVFDHHENKCQLSNSDQLQQNDEVVQLVLHIDCPMPIQGLSISINVLQDVARSHVHFAKFSIAQREPFEQLFTRRYKHHTFVLQPSKSGTVTRGHIETLQTYAALGFEHILIGFDHIAFLCALMLLTSRVNEIVYIVTGFTIGHSITLTLATLGVVTPNTAIVEAMIGYSIALVAIENISAQTQQSKAIALVFSLFMVLLILLSPLTGLKLSILGMIGLTTFSFCYLRLGDNVNRVKKLRPVVTCFFGLIHGFGFANILLEVGLPQLHLIPALLGFNLGVELGQITIVLASTGLSAMILIRLRQSLKLLFKEIMCATLCAVGLFWFVQRAHF